MYGKRKEVEANEKTHLLIRNVPGEFYHRMVKLAAKQETYMNRVYLRVIAAGVAHLEREQRIAEENLNDY